MFYQTPLVVLRDSLVFHGYTAILFTLSDLKTILLPISAFSCATAPLHSVFNLALGIFWIWIHQLMCNVSNQARSLVEDEINKPWRPIPSRRLTEQQAYLLRWVVVLACISLSTFLGIDMVWTTTALLLTTFLYDEMGLANHHLGKNVCNIAGYISIEVGATKIMGVARVLDDVSVFAICLSGAIIFTTIQAQDFPDVDGDRALGRVTFPIFAPEGSRIFTLLALPAWSWVLSGFWGIGPATTLILVALGTTVGCRYYLLRSRKADKTSFILFNVWLTIAHTLPAHARTNIFSA